MTHSSSPTKLSIVIAVASVCAVVAPPSSSAGELIPPICPLALHEAALDLEDSALEVRLFRATIAAVEEIYGLAADLLKDDAIDRMAYLEIRYERDAAKLDLERADLQLARQEALIEQLQLACDEEAEKDDENRAREMEQAYMRYRRADCDQQAKAIEVAETNLEFNRQWLASMLDLRAQVSTRIDVIRAQLDVQREELRREDAIRRTKECRAELKENHDGR